MFEFFYNQFYEYLGSAVVFNTKNFQILYSLIIGLIFLVGILAGSYPAFYLSKFKPAEIVKRKLQRNSSKMSFRKVLVIFQFVVSIILILGTIIIYQQIDYMKNSDLGFEKEGVVLIQFPFMNTPTSQKYSALRDEFLKNTNILGVTGAYTVPGINSQYNKSIIKKGDASENTKTFQCLPADYGFVKSMGLKIVRGRDFSNEFSADINGKSILLNESAVKALGLKNPVGEHFLIPGNGEQEEVEVVGVVEDFHIKSLHNNIEPLFIHIEPGFYIYIAAKIKPQNSAETLAYMKKVWKDIIPMSEMNYRYMEDAYYSYYKSEDKIQSMLSGFSILAVLISCLGLLGIASFMMNSRIKEVGIRKVLGASVSNITSLLSRQFALWILIANLIAWPAAYYLINIWLQNFAYRIQIGILPFILSGLFAFTIALMTVGFHTIKTAFSNPVNSLRYE